MKTFLTLSILMAASLSGATTYYISSGGNDANSGTATNSAFRRFSHALAAANNGDTVTFEDGAFDSGTNFANTFVAKQLTINSQHGAGSTRLIGGGAEGFGVTADGVKIQGLEFYNFSPNVSGHGGALKLMGNTEIDSCWFTNNQATANNASGGSLWISGKTVVANSCSFTHGYAQYEGGAVYCSGATFNANNCTFEENLCQYGGCIFADATCAVNLTGCSFTSNLSVFYGLATGGPGAPLTMTNCSVNHNRTFNSGNIPVILASGPTTVVGSTFSNNYGGTVLQLNKGGEIDSSTFFGNYAERPLYFLSAVEGLGAYTYILDNCQFAGNDMMSGAVFNEGDMAVADCTFYGNRSNIAGYGGALNTNGAILNASNCILWDDEGDAGDAAEPNGGSLKITYSDVEHRFTGIANANISVDPQFARAATYDLRLLPTSPCIGIGQTGGLNTDITGRGRHSNPTLGCYEAGLEVPGMFAVGPDGNKRILWNDTIGKFWLWKVTPAAVKTTVTYVAPARSSAAQLLVGADNTAYILITSPSDNGVTVWLVPTTGALVSKHYAPSTPDFRFKSASVDGDGTFHVLWASGAGKMQLLTVTPAGKQSSLTYGPYAG